MRKNYTLCLLLLCAILVVSCKKRTKKGEMPPLTIATAYVENLPSTREITFATTLEPLRSVTIEPRVSGYLQRVHYSSGEPVSRGDKLFTIDPTQLNTELYSARAELVSAEAALVEARNNYQRAEPLVKIDAISHSQYDQYRAEYVAAESSVKSAQEALRNAEINLSYSILTSPIDGLAANSPASLGDLVGVGSRYETLTTITSIDTMQLALAIPTAQYLKYVGSAASYDNSTLLSDIQIILPDSSKYSTLAEYDYTEMEITPNSSTVVIMANVANHDGVLKDGMFVRAQAHIGTAQNRLLLPQRAVTQMQGVSSVWVIAADSCAKFRPVVVGETFGDMWHIVSGVAEGERVALTGQMKLHEGAKVMFTNK